MISPVIGRIVHYTLNQDNVDAIEKRRKELFWLTGNQVFEGYVVPMIILAVWGPDNTSAVNGQAFIDGNHNLWVPSVVQDDSGKPGTWRLPDFNSPYQVPADAPTNPSRPSVRPSLRPGAAK